MISEKISLSKIIVESRKRPIDFVVVADLQKSIEQQGLLQNIGVKQTEAGYRLVFGAHRLEAVKALGWPEIQARIFPEDTSDDECLLAELQENRIRNDLTGAERKAFAAEVGRLIAKLSENCQTDVFANGKNEINGNWVDDLAKTSNTPAKTIYNWWSAFCRETGLTITPKQAGDENRNAFFAWLDAQKQAEESEKARKLAEAAADKQRKEQEAKSRRMEAEKRDFMEYLNATAQEWGADAVKEWIKEWLS